jgi:protein gp37
MEHRKIGDKARVWVITRGPDGRLQEALDPQFLTSLDVACSADEIANLFAIAAGRMAIAETRAW